MYIHYYLLEVIYVSLMQFFSTNKFPRLHCSFSVVHFHPYTEFSGAQNPWCCYKSVCLRHWRTEYFGSQLRSCLFALVHYVLIMQRNVHSLFHSIAFSVIAVSISLGSPVVNYVKRYCVMGTCVAFGMHIP